MSMKSERAINLQCLCHEQSTNDSLKNGQSAENQSTESLALEFTKDLPLSNYTVPLGPPSGIPRPSPKERRTPDTDCNPEKENTGKTRCRLIHPEETSTLTNSHQ